MHSKFFWEGVRGVLRGDSGHPFCSTLQLSRSFKMLSRSYNGGFFGNSFWCVPNYCLYRAAQRGLHSIGKAALLSRLSRSHTRTSLVCSLLVAQKAELAPHPPENVPSSKMRNEFKNTSPSDFPPGTVASKNALLRIFLNAAPSVQTEQLQPHVLVRLPFRSQQDLRHSRRSAAA